MWQRRWEEGGEVGSMAGRWHSIETYLSVLCSRGAGICLGMVLHFQALSEIVSL